MIELFEHNQKAYDSVIEHFENSNRTCVIHPTGTGKSFIALKWLYENKDKKCLFLTSTDVIIDQLVKYMAKCGLKLSDFPNLEIGTYHGMKDNTNKYDCIVLDEFHRCGALEWEKKVNNLLENNKESKILGTSATPIRYLDEKRDMSEEIFYGDIASKMSLAEAISLGILPVPMYINCLYTFGEEIDKVQDKINKFKNKEEKDNLQIRLDEAKKMLEKAYGLDKIFEKYIKGKSGKYVVFCKDREHMNKMKEEAKIWFSKINQSVNIGEVSYDLSDQTNKYTIDRFNNVKNDDINLLFSIEMLNEGLHAENIDGVIMLRPTISLILYLQQLGRALGSCKGTPLIFDIVNNSDNFDMIYNFKLELANVVEKRKKEIKDEEEKDRLDSIIKQFEIIDEYKSFIDVLNNISFDATFTWESWYKLAKAYYEEYGNLRIPSKFKTKDGVTYDEDGYALGSWIGAQKSYQNNMNATRKQMLDDIKMIWGNAKEEDFNKWYKLAKEYYEENGHLNVPRRYVTDKGEALGNWIERQRINQNNLTPEKREMLDKIGMVWESINDVNFNEWYNLAKNYYEEYGDLNIDYKFKTKDGITYDEDGYTLGNWVHTQRTRQDDLSVERRNMLDEIKMIWDLREFNQDVYYELAKKYYEKYKNLDVPYNFITKDGVTYDENGIRLGGWVRRLRTDYLNGKLSKREIDRMNELGISWDMQDKIWYDYYKLAKTYFEEIGNLKINSRYKTPEGVNLGGWIQRQKTDYLNKRLSKERIDKLEEIGIIWNVKEDDLVKGKIDSKSQDKVTDYLCGKLDELLNEYNNTKFEDSTDIDKLNKEFNDLIYSAKRKR